MSTPAAQETLARTRWTSLVSASRPQQWIKNVFVLSPLIFGRRLAEADVVFAGLTAFVAFCCGASGLYLINDIRDRRADAVHPEKCKRPVAAGHIGLETAGLTAVVWFALAFLVASFLPPASRTVLWAYIGLGLSYTIFLKRVLIVEAMVIAGGFVARVIAGSFAIQVVPSHWLILCTFLLALFLAFAKRQREIESVGSDFLAHRSVLQGYSSAYLERVNSILLASIIVCYSLYAVSQETVARFGTYWLGYGVVFVIYGLLRYLLLVQEGRGGDDPSQVVLRDSALRWNIYLWIAFNIAVIYRSPALNLLRAGWNTLLS